MVRTNREALLVAACVYVAAFGALLYELVQLAGRDPIRWADPNGLLSTIGNRTTLAEFLTVVALGGLAFAAVAGGSSRVVRLATAVSSTGLLAGAALTGTRSVLLGIGTGAALLVVLVWALHPGRHARAVSLVTAAAGAVGLAALLVLTPIGSRLTTTLQATGADKGDDLLITVEPSTAERLALYRISFEMLSHRPILGYGPDHFPVGVAEFRSTSDPPNLLRGLTTSPHSWLAYVATGTGLLGLASFLAIVVVGLRLTLKGGFQVTTIVAATSLLALLGAGLTTVTDIAIDWIFWATAGAIAATTAVAPEATVAIHKAARREVQPAVRAYTAPTLRAIGAVTVVGIALIVATSGLGALDASRAAKRGNDFRLGGQPAAAVDSTLRATRADAGRPEYWEFLGLAYASAGRWPEATAAFSRASLLAPYDVRYLGAEARAKLILWRSGDRTAASTALALAEKSVQVDGNSPYSHLTRAVVMQVTGNLAEAERSVDRSLELDPSAPDETLYVTAAQIKIDRGRPADAVPIARQGIAVLGATRRSVPLRYELARALVAVGDPAEALSELDVALSIGPNAQAEQLRNQLRSTLSK
jgi:O-antigen ligase/cytochrome c-type biogenesis protein CcmH/NrfG